MAVRSYEIAEMIDGFRIVEHNSNGARFHTGFYKTRQAAQVRVDKLLAVAARASAVAEVRKRAKFRCECLGECGIHVRRCTSMHGAPLESAHALCALKVVARDHDTNNVELDNLRAYCQVCHQHYEADERRTDPLFEIK